MTGGLGFVGGAAANLLLGRGDTVAVLDDGRDSVADGRVRCEVWRMSIDDPRVPGLAAWFRPDAVLHFAAMSSVGASEDDPLACLRENLSSFGTFLEGLASGCRPRIVFASSCAVYGAPRVTPTGEDHPLAPESWYGWTKAAGEALLRGLCGSGRAEALSLRCSNVVGAAYGIAEGRRREDHLVPRVIEAVRGDGRFVVNGSDWTTRDGTCARDYVHVLDAAQAFVAAADAMVRREAPADGRALNVASGIETTVLEVVRMIEVVSGRRIRTVMGPRRPGDAERFVASTGAAERLLKWRPGRSLEDAVRDAWDASERPAVG